MEHLYHFDLRQDPFKIEPDLRVYFDSPSHREAQQRVERGLRQMKGLTVMTGEGGTGKTLLARRIFNELEEEVFEASLMVMLPGAAEPGPLLQRFARQLGVEQPADDRASLMAEIYEMLAAVREEGRHSVLILDDAHLLGPGPMAEICGLLSLEYEDCRLLSLLLVGLPALDDSLLQDAGLESRVDVRFRLQPLDLENASAYLDHRLQAAGGRPDILAPDAVTRLFELGGGRPRLINTLADNALFEAYLAKHAQISSKDVERAAVDLGIEASPVAPATPERASASVDLETPAPERAEPEVAAPDQAPLSLEDSIEDLGALLDISPESAASDEFSSLLVATEDQNGVSSTIDLDSEVEAVLSEAESDCLEAQPLEPLPTFAAQNANNPVSAEATRIAIPDEGPPKNDSSDELDDLFVELLDD